MNEKYAILGVESQEIVAICDNAGRAEFLAKFLYDKVTIHPLSYFDFWQEPLVKFLGGKIQ